jgi:lipopolysaccharide/colanic/teichoic acid biosynthesis glycosyltransferase
MAVLLKRGQKVKQPKVKSRSLSFQGLYGEFFKRLFDIVFSFSVLILCSPLYIILALLIALSSKGPIFYVQERVGKNYRSFNCIKFRTMVNNADEILVEMMATSPNLREEYEDNFGYWWVGIHRLTYRGNPTSEWICSSDIG